MESVWWRFQLEAGGLVPVSAVEDRNGDKEGTDQLKRVIPQDHKFWPSDCREVSPTQSQKGRTGP